MPVNLNYASTVTFTHYPKKLYNMVAPADWHEKILRVKFYGKDDKILWWSNEWFRLWTRINWKTANLPKKESLARFYRDESTVLILRRWNALYEVIVQEPLFHENKSEILISQRPVQRLPSYCPKTVNQSGEWCLIRYEQISQKKSQAIFHDNKPGFSISHRSDHLLQILSRNHWPIRWLLPIYICGDWQKEHSKVRFQYNKSSGVFNFAKIHWMVSKLSSRNQIVADGRTHRWKKAKPTIHLPVVKWRYN